jgi:6-phospho-beta-glucosidase
MLSLPAVRANLKDQTMARIKLAYIGGGSTRGPGTMASFIDQGQNFDGSEVVLIDLNEERLALVKKLADKLARVKGLDLTITTTTDRRAGLADCDAVLTSYRPGGFEARYFDESIPLKHGVIGQETQGPGGFFMALRSIHIMQGIIADMEQVCPKAILFNYTNPINLVSEAVTHHSDLQTYSFCEGPLIFASPVVRAVGLDPAKVQTTMVGLNHGCWSVRHTYEGEDLMPVLAEAYDQARNEPGADSRRLRMVELALAMGSIPASYFQYYYFKDEVLAELQAKPTTRAQDILAAVPDYWQHYRQQAESAQPQLDPKRSRGGIHELELAIDVMDAIFNDRDEVWPVNLPNQGALADFPDDLVVEVFCRFDRTGAHRLPQEQLPRQVLGLLKMLGEYQALAGEAAWSGTRREAIQALASNPLCFSLAKATAIYDELAAAHRAYLPERLLS